MDALQLLSKDHKEVESLFKRFEALPDGSPKERRKIVDRIIAELSRHAAIEEQIFYPAVRAALPDEEDHVLESLEEHHVVKWTLHELESLSPEAERFPAKVAVLMESVRHHIGEEESELFPKIREALTPARRRTLGERMARAKAVAPSRPHPRSPDSPPSNLFANPAAAVMDRGRELVRSLPERTREATKTLRKLAPTLKRPKTDPHADR